MDGKPPGGPQIKKQLVEIRTNNLPRGGNCGDRFFKIFDL